MLLGLSVVVSVGTVLAMYLLADRRRSGWLVSLGNQPLWFAITVMTEAWGLMMLNVLMTAIAVKGLLYWNRGRRREL